MVDVDVPRTWVRFRESLCTTCEGTCCKMPVEITFADLVKLGHAQEDESHLSKQKLFKRLRKLGVLNSYRQSTELFTLARQASGACVYLDAGGKCSVYEKRPGVCRSFPAIGPRPGFCPYKRAK